MQSRTLKRSIKEILLYLAIGFLTTVISLSTYWLFTRLVCLDYYISNILSWLIAVTFAFFTNRGVVFGDFGETGRKAVLFFASRIFTLGLETALLFSAIEILSINDFITKIFVQVVVIVANYLLGKLFVFRHKR